ncbi:hypothetical protein [Primorskyibacter sp. 2E233]|uniref:hypothetical protein n=1 Tax=Primorskyibacter sp. 2E233 TaxID=3413431 RepID=UPI003BF434DE
MNIAAIALVAFVVLQFRNIQRAQQIAGILLLAIAFFVSLSQSNVIEVFETGVLKTLPFLLVFASVGWLRAAAWESPSVADLRAALSRMGPGRRFAAFILSAHTMGAGFNLAGLGLLAPMLDDGRENTIEGMRLRCAIMWGFAAATCWSPFFVGTAAVLATMPGLRWPQVVPYGLLIAAGFLIYATVYDRFVRRRGGVRRQGVAEKLDLGPAVARLLLAITVLFVITLTLVEGTHLKLTTAIALSAPTYSLAWLWLVHGRKNAPRVAQIARSVLAGYSGMRTETTLFVCANIFGAAVASMLASGDAGGIAMPGLTGVMFVDAVLVIWIYLAVCAVGLHPIILLVVFTTVTDPASLGIPLPLMAATMMALWGMGTSVSPLSGTTLFMSQMSPVSSFVIAWRWNGVFVILSTFWVAAVLTLFS